MRSGLAALLAILVTPTSIKCPTSKVVVSGDEMAGVVEIADGPSLAASNLFSVAFLDTARHEAPPPATAERYRVDFYLPNDRWWFARLFERRRLHLAYVAYFVPQANGPGWVYLPGAGDPWSSWNHQTIIRPELEGHWSYADARWGRDLATRIASKPRLTRPRACGAAIIGPSDSAYKDVAPLRDTLAAHGLTVRCAYHGMLDDVIGASSGATVLTERGIFAVSFFPSAEIARSISITSTVRAGILLTVLRRPGWPRSDTLSGGLSPTMFVHDRALFNSFGAFVLDSALRSSLGAR